VAGSSKTVPPPDFAPGQVIPFRARYHYEAVAVRVIDGDTVVLTVSLGFDTWVHNRTFRLLGCNAREHADPGGADATANLAALLPPGAVVDIMSVKPDKFGGRYDAQVTLADGRDLVTLLIEQQWAAPWNGRGRKPVPPWPRAVAA
jgi:endonuclease YncB( thermonuclease family)